MKKVLITAKNSYIGNAFADWVSDTYDINFISCRTNDWKKENFAIYDSILHVAGIAHVSTNPEMEAEYYRVNRDLTIELARKAKAEGVKQFIFMSSIIVYGNIDSMANSGLISKDTQAKPKDFYGKSKLEADLGLQKLSDEKFITSIIRTPVVYGPNSKGNFSKLIKIAEKTFIFPKIKNARSMIYIDNLSEFIKRCIDNKSEGIFFPQNKEYVNTSQIVFDLALVLNKKIIPIKFLTPFIIFFSKRLKLITKVFGNKVYDKKMSGSFDYCVVDYHESLKRSLERK